MQAQNLKMLHPGSEPYGVFKIEVIGKMSQELMSCISGGRVIMHRYFLLFVVFVAVAAINAGDMLYYGLVEFRRGNMPVIITIPHGGKSKPDHIKDRTKDILTLDTFSMEYAMATYDSLCKWTGRSPYLVISHLHRIKADMNRDSANATEGDSTAFAAWKVFHDAISRACEEVTGKFGRGHIFDMHTCRTLVEHIDVGQRWNRAVLMKTNEELNASDSLNNISSIKSLAGFHNKTISELVRGPESFGAILEKHGVAALPSPARPKPFDDVLYFPGGYDIIKHGSGSGGTIDATQIEVPKMKMRDSSYAKKLPSALARSIIAFMKRWYGMT
ncbi:MAG: hypothetical protein V1913_17045 [Fibrobacterota bacterium]